MVTLADIADTEENLFITDLEFFELLYKLTDPVFGMTHLLPLEEMIYAMYGKVLEKVFGGYVILGRCAYCGRDAGIKEWNGYKHCVSCGGPII